MSPLHGTWCLVGMSGRVVARGGTTSCCRTWVRRHMGRSQHSHGLQLQDEHQQWSFVNTVAVLIVQTHGQSLDGKTVVTDGSTTSLFYESSLWSSVLFKHTTVCWPVILTGDFPNLFLTDKQHVGYPISEMFLCQMCKANSISFLLENSCEASTYLEGAEEVNKSFIKMTLAWFICYKCSYLSKGHDHSKFPP